MRVRWRYIWVTLLAVGLCWLAPAKAELAPAQTFYESGNYGAAIERLLPEIQQGDASHQAAAWANLATLYQQLGRWPEANQAIATSLRLAVNAPVLAQVLELQGQLQLAQGQAEAALFSWQQSAKLYQQQDNLTGLQQSQFDQVQALQALGLYRRALAQLSELNDQLQPDQPLKVSILRSLGEALQVAGDLSQSRQMLELALRLSANPDDANPDAVNPDAVNPDAMAATQLSLGNLTQREASTALSLSNLTPEAALSVLQAPRPSTLAAIALQQRQVAAAQQFVQQMQQALWLYQQAAQQNSATAPLNQIDALITLQRYPEAVALATALEPQIAALPLNHSRLSQQIKLALAEMQLEIGSPDIQLIAAAQQAATLGDLRQQSFALGSLGQYYEQHQQPAIRATEQALMLAQSMQAADLAYRWQWQLGRLLKQQGDRTGAIAAYSEAVRSLQSLRSDLVGINREVQFSFQSQVEPVYRELADLLLAADIQSSQVELDQARQVIEGLQVAELDNFLREACLETELKLDQVIDRDNLSAAVLYTIVLPDRVEVILKLPQQKLQHYSSAVARPTLEATVDELLNELKLPYVSQRSQVLSQQVYRWLLAPASERLNPSIETLVFVLDGSLRSLPLAALNDGQQFLIETYSVAVAPGLRLADPQPLRYANLLIAGLSEARDNFAPLKFVAQEIQQIKAEIPSKVLFNESFTQANLQKQVNQSDYAIVHIATHGQFSSNAANTFILAWDRPINVNELGQLLQREAISPQPIELLVLSACQTAVGDRRAALGMAGVSIRAGARSTLASLWNLQDDSGAALMEQFYRSLGENQVSKAEALRQAQLALLKDPQYGAPRFWAPYMLLGNWL